MKTLIGLIAALAVSAAYARVHAVIPSEVLPFYDSADLTPKWVRSVDHHVASFNLVTQSGEPLTNADLNGRVHIASFVYTRCAGVCPMMVQQLSKVQSALATRPGAVLVSFSVTPNDDTPEVLADFGLKSGIDPSRWKLVTGSAEQIYGLARTSYFADDGRLSANQPVSAQFLHTEKVLLVDRKGRLRGVYNGTLAHEIDKLLADLDALLVR